MALQVSIVETAMNFTGAGFEQEPISQSVHILENVTIGDALTQKWRDETKQYRDEIVQGDFLGDALTLASSKAYPVTLKALPAGFQLWL
ncbi:hypothetical protein ACW5XW_23815 [Aeromonas piscicola]|uniref:hypothetical protein n=1 Tax=Aeromonas piscicola TaxID=600645 RepID=UPI0012E00314|nr:hypothetical protein [Aeromonas piscicola]